GLVRSDRAGSGRTSADRDTNAHRPTDDTGAAPRGPRNREPTPPGLPTNAQGHAAKPAATHARRRPREAVEHLGLGLRVHQVDRGRRLPGRRRRLAAQTRPARLEPAAGGDAGLARLPVGDQRTPGRGPGATRALPPSAAPAAV